MKKALLAIALVLLVHPRAFADAWGGQALLAYENYDRNDVLTGGFRQTYDLRLDKALTGTSNLRLSFRADDFNGAIDQGDFKTTNDFRELQPTGELNLNAGTVRAHVRSDYFDITSKYGNVESARTIQRSTGSLFWEPESFPRLSLVGQQNATRDEAARVDLTEESLYGSAQYFWRGLEVIAEQRYASAVDPFAGYDRKTNTEAGRLAYAYARTDGRFAAGANASAQLQSIDEKAIGEGGFVLTPVPIGRALHGIDDTPSDDSDHPLSPLLSLIDGNQTVSTGISLGPDGASFHNIAIDLGRIDRMDEIRILVRDAAGNPLRTGGGPVTFDVYVSTDGILWSPLNLPTTTFNAPLSLYSVTFPILQSRWLKVVSFGVNSEATFVTEVQAFYHSSLAPGAKRKGNQDSYTAFATLLYHPTQKLTFTYNGNYNSLNQDLEGVPGGTSTTTEHFGIAQYDFARAWSARGQYLKRDSASFTGSDDTLDELTGYLDYVPTRQLHVTFEGGRQNQMLSGSAFVVDTKAIHTTAQIFKSLAMTLDVGTQTQTFDLDHSVADRQFLNLSSNMQLLRTLRLMLLASMQRTDTNSTDPNAQILGPEKDNRVSGDFIWRTGPALTISVRLGYVDGLAISGFTHRYRAEWFPFGDGTVTIRMSYDEDIDPTVGRTATRAIFNPHWQINRYATFDVNYTDVATEFRDDRQQQRTLFATFTLTR